MASLCYLEAVAQQGHSTRLYYEGFTNKCHGSVSNGRTCFVIFVCLSLNPAHCLPPLKLSLEIYTVVCGCVPVCVIVCARCGYRNGNRAFSAYFQLFPDVVCFVCSDTNSLVSPFKLCKNQFIIVASHF